MISMVKCIRSGSCMYPTLTRLGTRHPLSYLMLWKVDSVI
jgi:hypothetical protein